MLSPTPPANPAGRPVVAAPFACGGGVHRRVLVVVALLAALATAPPARSQGEVPHAAGLITVESENDFDGTVSRLAAAIADAGLVRVAVIDHTEASQKAGMPLPPTTLFLFGNPKAATPMMQAARTAGLDLPQKILVWQSEGGTVFITFDDPAYLAQRHGLDSEAGPLGLAVEALELLVRTAASSEMP